MTCLLDGALALHLTVEMLETLPYLGDLSGESA